MEVVNFTTRSFYFPYPPCAGKSHQYVLNRRADESIFGLDDPEKRKTILCSGNLPSISQSLQ
jgi:hypothetical protein